MKKLLLSLILGVVSTALFAQTPTIVSTQVQKRNAVIEEFTGTNCGYCPLGHQKTSEYSAAHPGRVVPINIHTGGYAAHYTTSFGAAIAGQSNLEGYPAGTLNRKTSGCNTNDIGPQGSSWQSQANSLLNENSPVNVAATASIDVLTNVLTVHVEVYYTADVAQNANLLNVAILQNNVKGPQSNYGNYNPTQITSDGQYLHMHMLRHLITGQWGEEIATNTNGTIPQGTFVSKDYTYTFPNTIGDVDVVFGEMTLAVFVTDKEKAGCSDLHGPNIWTGISVEPAYTGIDGNAGKVGEARIVDKLGCVDSVDVYATVKNNGAPMTSFVVNCENTSVSANQDFTVSQSVQTFQATEVYLGTMPIQPGQTNTFKLKLTNINSASFTDAQVLSATHFKAAVSNTPGYPTLYLKTDKSGGDITWKVLRADNLQAVQQGGPYPNGAIKRDTVEFSGIPSDGCYIFEIKDAGGDGMNNGNGTGQYEIKDAAGQRIYYSNGKFDAGESTDFQVYNISVGLNNADANICQSMIYPNPAQDVATLSINLNKADVAKIFVVDVMGRVVVAPMEYALTTGENKIELDTRTLESGSYFVRIVTNDGMTTNRLSISK